jgi:hypothetical protein
VKTVFFIGQEKPLINLKKYGYLEKFLRADFLVITTEEIASKYKFSNNVIVFKSSWTNEEWVTFLDYLYIKNFITTYRKTLNISLRTRLFGPYKLNSIKRIIFSFKYFIKFWQKINFALIYQTRHLKPDDLLSKLREKNILGPGDSKKIMSLLANQNIQKAIVFTTFNDPILYDFVSVCKDLGIFTTALPDCWDNISTSPAIPEYINKICLWSEQQSSEVKKFYPSLFTKTEIYGSYRINKKSRILLNSKLKNEYFNILYLESSLFEDREFAIRKIAKSISESHGSNDSIKKIKFTIRQYPGYRPTEPGLSTDLGLLESFKIGEWQFEIAISKNGFLKEDFASADIVFSELTTAGLEAAFEKLPVIFVGSNKSPRYLTTYKAFQFSFGKDLLEDFVVLDLGLKSSLHILTNLFDKLFKYKQDNYANNYQNRFGSRKLSFYAEEFNFHKWDLN